MIDDLKKRSLELHLKHRGKITVESKIQIKNNDDLSLVYSPGVAEPCLRIKDNPEDIYKYTSKGNMVAIITDGSAVLGLGNLGASASLPVMEGKAILFKQFAGVDAFPICLKTQDTEEIISIIKNISTSFGGINLEDISSPKCVIIERRLKEELDIPVFHDDQHGTAIVSTAALINACRLTGKKIEDLEIVLSGTGAAGSSIARILKDIGVKHVYGYNIDGVVLKEKYDSYSFVLKELIDEEILSIPNNLKCDTLEELMKNKDVFIGVSAKGIVSKEMIQSMNKDPFIFAMANPEPEISPDEALLGGAYIIGTGRSDYPNQINNVLAFPGIFRGALDSRAKKITDSMKLSAAKAIAYILKDNELTRDYIIPSPFDERVSKAVSEEVIKEVHSKTK